MLGLEGVKVGPRTCKDGRKIYMGTSVDLSGGACAILKSLHPDWDSGKVSEFLRSGDDVQAEIARVAVQRAMSNGRRPSSLFEFTSGNSALIRFKNDKAGVKSSGPRKMGKREAAAVRLLEEQQALNRVLAAKLAALADQGQGERDAARAKLADVANLRLSSQG